jgi:ribosome-binding factor A
VSIKIDRIASNLVKEISYILMMEVKDRDIKFVTVTDCKLTNDLGYAKVYYTVLDDSKKEDISKGLKNARGFIRRELASRIELRHIPELEFIFDESIEYGKMIEQKIAELSGKEEDN